MKTYRLLVREVFEGEINVTIDEADEWPNKKVALTKLTEIIGKDPESIRGQMESRGIKPLIQTMVLNNIQ